MDAVTALERSYDQLAKVVANLSPDQLRAPSPCADWDVRATLNHALGAAWMFTLVNQGQPVGEDAGDVVGDDPSGAVEAAAMANVSAWQQPGALEGDRTYPFGAFPAAAGLMINVGEIAVHAWDIAQASGQQATLDPDVAGTVYEFYATMPLDVYREHGAFGPEVAVDESAPAATKLLALLGRTP